VSEPPQSKTPRQPLARPPRGKRTDREWSGANLGRWRVFDEVNAYVRTSARGLFRNAGRARP
jgi:hypothetical protein